MKVRQRLARRMAANAAPVLAQARRVRRYGRLLHACQIARVRPLGCPAVGVLVRERIDVIQEADAHLSGLLREGAL